MMFRRNVLTRKSLTADGGRCVAQLLDRDRLIWTEAELWSEGCQWVCGERFEAEKILIKEENFEG
jgi:hypothetical protein